MNKPRTLDDVARSQDFPAYALPLDEVGMRGIDLPLPVALQSGVSLVHAKADVAVSLPATDRRGIHMSRLYRVIAELPHSFMLMQDSLKERLQEIMLSHEECATDSVSLALHFSLLRRQTALITPHLGGWLSYPVTIRALLDRKGFSLQVQVSATYSSTCPCSAALARQLIEEDFRRDFAGTSTLDKEQVAQWIRSNATQATPHSQRSVAHVSLQYADEQSGPRLDQLIDEVEKALATRVQTAVKREDEQAFARLNGQNLMYVEDAARRVLGHLRQLFPDRTVQVDVEHRESLHPHDAYAASTSLGNSC